MTHGIEFQRNGLFAKREKDMGNFKISYIAICWKGLGLIYTVKTFLGLTIPNKYCQTVEKEM